MNWFADNANNIGLVFFFSFFVLMAVWVYLPRNKRRIESHSEIPLREDDHERS